MEEPTPIEREAPDKITPGKKMKGLALLTPERRREIASQGGKRAHELRRAHQFTSEEARQAGRKGGKKVSQDRAHMKEIGKRGREAKVGPQKGEG